MIGKNSIFRTYHIQSGKTTVKFIVQVNKNGGICDIVPKVNAVLSDFQGQQLASEVVEESLIKVLTLYVQ